MADKGFSLEFSGDYKALKKFFDEKKGLPKSLEKHVKKATIKNSLVLVSKVRQNIRGRKFQRNAKVTELIKGNKPALINQGQLHNAIAYELMSSFKSRVGVLDGQFAELARRVHEGFVTPITPKMRAAIFGKIKESSGSGAIDSLPPKESDGFLRVPGRPFLSIVFEDPKVQRELNKNWEAAVKNAIKEASGGLAPE